MRSIEVLLKLEFQEDVKSVRRVSGGSIADTRYAECKSGKKYFIKSYGIGSKVPKNEKNGLIEIARSREIRVPEVLFLDEQYLVLEYIEEGGRKENFSEEFGRKFARLHKMQSDKYGFYEDNYIGSSTQINSYMTSWIKFFIRNRLDFQITLLERKGAVDQNFLKYYSQLVQRIPQLIEGTEELPSLLHGDLWRGNFLIDINGEPVLIDPAVYYGHREADLAMTKLFGGFDAKFYGAYNEEYPLKPGWKERQDLYMLYHVLNHLNLFGQSYYSQALSIIKKYL